MQNKKSLLKTTYTAIFTTIIVVATSTIKFSTGLGEGYIHFGDSIIYLTACILPFPYCIFASALGGCLADVLSGFAIWSIPTAIIKSLNVIPFLAVCKSSKNDKLLNKKTILATVFSGIITILGYFVAESILYSSAFATLSLLGNSIQAISNAIIFFVIATALDRTKFKSIFKEFK